MHKSVTIVYLVLFLLLISTVSADVIINEIMYNPDQCSDTYCEWIELYNNGTEAVNLSGWTLEENDFDDFVINADSYLVVARKLDGTGDCFDAYWGNGDGEWNSSDGFDAVDGNFGTGLSNGGETVSLTNGSYLNEIDYTPFTAFANGNGFTLSRHWNGSWGESNEINGTPGRDNFERPVVDPLFNNWINPFNNTLVNGLLNISVNISNGNNTYVNFDGVNHSMSNNGDIWYYEWDTLLNNDGSYDITVYYNGSETLYNITVDNSAPLISFISPLDKDTVQGNILLNASVYDLLDVEVVFELWNETGSNLININATGDYYAYLDSSLYPDGTYYIYATAWDVLSNTNESEFIEVTIANDIYADAGTDQNVSEGVLVSFNGSASYSSMGIISYYWDFDDGSNATGAEPTHVFSEDGIYNVLLTITDTLNRTKTDEVIITVEDVNPHVTISISPISFYESFGYIKMNASLSSAANDYDNITAYYWVLNYTYTDKTGTHTNYEYYTGVYNVTSAFNSNGPYTIYIRSYVQDEDSNNTVGITAEVLFSNDDIEIEDKLPDVAIDEGSFNASIDLDDYFDDEETADADISFSVINNNVDIDIDSEHIMNISSSWVGEEDVIITASDENGSTVNQTFTVTVNDVMHAPVIVGSIPDITIDENETYVIDLTSYESDVDDSDEYLTWSLNSVDSSLLSYSIDSGSDVVTITPKTYGVDTVIFILTDSGGLTDQQNVIVTVNQIMNETGNETQGNETEGNETQGNETQDNETTNDEESIYSNLNIKEIKVYVDGDKDSNADEDGGVIDEVKPDSEIKLKIEIENNGSMDIEDIDVEGVIYDIDDGDDIEEDEDFKDLDPGEDDDVELKFDIPLEIEEDDYLLELEIEGKDENGTKQKAYVNFTVQVEKEKHEIEILVADLSTSSLECSRSTDLEVKVINLGRDDEDEVRITARNAELDIDIERDDIELETDPDDDNTYATTFDLFLDEASAGTYMIEVTAYYDDDEESDSEDVMVTVKDCDKKVKDVKEDTELDIDDLIIPTLPPEFTQKTVEKEYTFRDSSLYSLVITIMFIMMSGMVILLVGGIIIKR